LRFGCFIFIKWDIQEVLEMVFAENDFVLFDLFINEGHFVLEGVSLEANCSDLNYIIDTMPGEKVGAACS